MKMNAAEAMVGLMFSRMVENICRAKVRWFGPATNMVNTTSSSEVANANTAPEMMPGLRQWQGHAAQHREWPRTQAFSSQLYPFVYACQSTTNTDEHQRNGNHCVRHHHTEIGIGDAQAGEHNCMPTPNTTAGTTMGNTNKMRMGPAKKMPLLRSSKPPSCPILSPKPWWLRL